MSGKKFEGLPDFLVIGAGKSGTTSIDKYLNQHPGIFVPKSKEPNFFGYENKTEAEFAGNPDDLAHFRRSVTTLETYLGIFADARPDQIKGETSNTYMYHPQAPERIKHYNPDIKLIAVLRQPAARLYSRFMHLARENRAPSENFSDCLDRNSVWWKRNDLISEGFYYRNLKPYFDLFSRAQMRIYLYEDLQQSPQKVMQEIYAFLGADPTFTPNVSLRYNESGLIKNRLLNRIYGQGGLLSRSIRAILPGTLVQRLRSNLSLKKKILDLRGKNLYKPKIDPELKRTLTTDVYGEDIRQLQNLIGRDLSHWLNV